MSLDNPNIVDAIGFERESGDIILSIIDSLDWNDEHVHLDALKEKIKAYVRFIESGEIHSTFPEAAVKKIMIDLIGRFPLSKTAECFLSEANEIVREIQVTIRFKLLPNPTTCGVDSPTS